MHYRTPSPSILHYSMSIAPARARTQAQRSKKRSKIALENPFFFDHRDASPRIGSRVRRRPPTSLSGALHIPHYLDPAVPRRASISSAIAFFARWFGSSCSDARGSFVVGLVLAPVATRFFSSQKIRWVVFFCQAGGPSPPFRDLVPPPLPPSLGPAGEMRRPPPPPKNAS